jgi:hypothetical protein
MILTPILLLAVIAVLGFVGCGFQPGVASSVSLDTTDGLAFGGTMVTVTGSGTDFETVNSVVFSDSSGFSANATGVSTPSGQIFTLLTPPYTGTISGTGAAVTVTINYANSMGQSNSSSLDNAFTYYPPVTHVQTVAAGAPGQKTITVPALTLQGNELLLVTVQWAGPATAPTIAGASFQPAPMGGAFNWNTMNVQCFYAVNATNGQIVVSTTLSQNSSAPWSVCVSAYDFADPANPIYSSVQGNPNYKVTNPQAPAINANPGDLVYAVAYAADPTGPFPGSNALIAGAGFTAESGPITYAGVGTAIDPLVEDAQITSATSVVAQATNTTANVNPRGWILAMTIKVAKA